jgi:excinuclease UvrABC ATPase subunit
MNKNFIRLIVVAVVLCSSVSLWAQEKNSNKYVGTKICAPCHKSEKAGNQIGIWQKSKHAEAFKVLETPKAAEVAKAKGLKTPASESPECLQCHVVVADAKIVEKTFDMKQGNQCEVCHGAGSAYKSMAIMKDKAKSIAAGMTEYKDEAAIEAKCKTCHNDKSPTFKEFRFKEMWAKIKHPVPKKS